MSQPLFWFSEEKTQIEKDLSFQLNNKDDKVHTGENDLIFAENVYGVFDLSDCVVVMTEWDEFSKINWNLASKKMRKPGWVFDTKNIVDQKKVKESGLNLWVLGKNYYL